MTNGAMPVGYCTLLALVFIDFEQVENLCSHCMHLVKRNYDQPIGNPSRDGAVGRASDGSPAALTQPV